MPEWYDIAYMFENQGETMPDQLKSQDLMPHLEQLSDEQLQVLGDGFHALLAQRRAPVKPGAQKAPFNAGNFFKNFIQVVQAVWPVLQPLIAGQQGGPPRNP